MKCVYIKTVEVSSKRISGGTVKTSKYAALLINDSLKNTTTTFYIESYFYKRGELKCKKNELTINLSPNEQKIIFGEEMNILDFGGKIKCVP